MIKYFQETFKMNPENNNVIIKRLESEFSLLNITIDDMFENLLNSGVANSNASVKLIIKNSIDEIKIKLLNDTIKAYKDIIINLETQYSEILD